MRFSLLADSSPHHHNFRRKPMLRRVLLHANVLKPPREPEASCGFIAYDDADVLYKFYHENLQRVGSDDFYATVQKLLQRAAVPAFV